MLAVFRGVTVATYLIAAFHKLNHDFLNPEFSCANYGVIELVDYWQISARSCRRKRSRRRPALVLVAEFGIPCSTWRAAATSPGSSRCSFTFR